MEQNFVVNVSIVGALNWGLYGLFAVDLVAFMFGYNSYLSKFIYISVVISGAYLTVQTILSKEVPL